MQLALIKGKWITSVTSSADGVVIKNQCYNITNGKDGEAGAAGTEWTISEDGFGYVMVEKTSVKAVGQDAPPEVKKENGKWYLWNGTEFEEFTGAVLLQPTFLITTLQRTPTTM